MLANVCYNHIFRVMKCLLLNQYAYCQINFEEIHFQHSNFAIC